MEKIKSIILPIFIFIIVVSIVSYLYFFKLTPLREQVTSLESQKDTFGLEQMRLLRLREDYEKYQAEMLMHKSTLDRYQAFANEYGSYDNILLLIRDIERRADVALKEVELTGKDLNFSLESDYHGLRIFVSSLENINYLYSSNRIFIKGISERFSPEFVNRSQNNLQVEINAKFNLDNIESMKNKIQLLIEELGLNNAYVE
jgi:hypothetical protein